MKTTGKEMNTEEFLCEIAFRSFLEKGYEATNLRQLSQVIGIKAASIYFYFDSKKALFNRVFENIGQQQLQIVEELISLNLDLTAREQLFLLFRFRLRTCMSHSAEHKFLLRYRLFPAEELVQDLRQAFEAFERSEYNLFEPIITKLIQEQQLDELYTPQTFYREYRIFENAQTNEMLISGIAITEKEIESQWKKFLSMLIVRT